MSVSAPLGLASLSAELTSFATGEQVASTDEFELRSGTAESGVWASAEPFLLEQLGNYRVHVEATDTDGNQVRRENAGTLQYVVTTAFEEVEIDRPSVTYEDRTVTVSGLLTGRWPGTGVVEPLADFRVSINSFFAGESVITGADGRFTGTTTISTLNELVWAQYSHDNARPHFRSSSTDQFVIAIEPRPTRITIKANPHRVDLGEATTLTGRLQWRTPAGWEPIPDAQIGVLFCDETRCPTVAGRPVTDDDGRFTLDAEPFSTGRYQATFSAVDRFGMADPFVARAEASSDIAVLQPAWFSDFSATRNDAGQVLVEGQLRFGNRTPLDIPVKVQYSPNGVAGWKTVLTVDAEPGGSFIQAVDEAAAGHWRAYYPGQRDQFASAVSPVSPVP